jgi:SAM-dependent methyltransferase
MSDLFNAAAMYDEDYLNFFAAPAGLSEIARHRPCRPGTDTRGDGAAELAWRLLDLRPGMSVLDVACGHGEMANHLAARGCRVTGLDSSAVFLDRARADVLRPDGKLVMDLDNLTSFLASYCPSRVVAARDGRGSTR